ncbi:hypothetical protein GCM10023311_08790 [Flaviramulus aquimarinus]|uniref:Uncharacterized protein n=1 Tax=Flaviramulus aquimarinus TaxID=1170456 RepID=A0ABP9EW58_9FLAO
MLSFKRKQHIISYLLLLITLITFSGFTYTSSNFEKTQTELVVFSHEDYNSSVEAFQYSTKVLKYISYNPYLIFNFKGLLNLHYFNFVVTLKHQKKTVLQFLNHFNLEQNLIAQTHSIHYQGVFIE